MNSTLFARTKHDRGQAAIEFVLIAPLLFFIFFAVIQAAYTAYVSFAVQRAALAVARAASLNTPTSTDPAAFQTQLALSLLPLVRLNPKTLPAILASQTTLSCSEDLKEVVVRVRYPMPILVPMMGRILGTPFLPASSSNQTSAFQSIISLLNISIPDPSSIAPSSVFWVTYEASTFNEGYIKTSRFSPL